MLIGGESLEPKDYFLAAMALFISAFILIFIAGLLSMFGASAETINWIYLTIPAALFSFAAGVSLVIAGVLRALISR